MFDCVLPATLSINDRPDAMFANLQLPATQLDGNPDATARIRMKARQLYKSTKSADVAISHFFPPWLLLINQIVLNAGSGRLPTFPTRSIIGARRINC